MDLFIRGKVQKQKRNGVKKMKAGTDAGPRKGDGGGGVRGVVQEETDELGKTETEGQLLGLKHMQGNEKRQDEYVMDGRANAVLQGRKRS